MSTNITKQHILRAWFHYGSTRPPILFQVESDLWRKLFAIARGVTTAVHAIQEFIADVEPLLVLAVKEQSFFDSGVGPCVDLPVGLSYERSDGPNRRSAQFDKENGEEPRIPSGATTFRLSTTKHGGSMEILPWLAPSRERRSSQRRLSPKGPSSEQEDISFIESAFLRPRGTGPLNDCSLSTCTLPRTNFGSMVRKPTRGQAYVVVSMHGRREIFWPTCSTSQRVLYLVGLLERSNRYQSSHGNALLFYKLTLGMADREENLQFVTSEKGLCIRGVSPLSAVEFGRLDQAGMLPEVLRGHVLVTFGSQRSSTLSSLDSKLLSNIGSISLPRHACMETRPYPVSPELDPAYSATFTEFLSLLSSAGATTIMSFPFVPSLSASNRSISINTDVFSKQYRRTRMQPGLEPSPQCLPGWHFVATANAVQKGKLSPDSFNTELAVWEGCVIVFVGLMVDDRPFLGKLTNLRLPQSDLLANLCAVSAILLFPGDHLILQAGTPYDIVTLKPSVCHGSPFYCFATMEQTLAADLYNRIHSPKLAVCPAFNRAVALTDIAFHWHDVLVNDTEAYFAPHTPEGHVYPHVPNVLSVDGLLQIFSLGILLILGEVYVRPAGDTSAEQYEAQQQYKLAFRQLQEVISSLDRAVIAISSTSSITISVAVLWKVYLVQQGVVIMHVLREQCFEEWLEEQIESEKEAVEAIWAVMDGSHVEIDLAVHPHSLSFMLSSDNCTSMSWLVKPLLDNEFALRRAT
ncbi:hypothetical protein VNI00_016631 [Paramarasmius palmivorus]|uniref:Uncharacterized protein n=1 Tax=Paramarasmius palmivorus TaxID=297713 RepID=A0AAW0BC59_9AGAR